MARRAETGLGATLLLAIPACAGWRALPDRRDTGTRAEEFDSTRRGHMTGRMPAGLKRAGSRVEGAGVKWEIAQRGFG